MKKIVSFMMSVLLMLMPFERAFPQMPMGSSRIGQGSVPGQLEPEGDSMAKPGTGTIQADSSSTISLDLKGMDVVEVLKTLATKKAMNLVIGANVRGRVTMFLKDVNVDDAFELILISNELAADKRGEITYILTQREYEMMYGDRYGDKKEAKIVQLKYAKATEVEKVLTKIKTNVGRIISDDASNTLVLIDGPRAIKQEMLTIESMDKPTKTEVFELSYSAVDDIKDRLKDYITPNVGTMQVDARTNKIVITDVEIKMAKIREIVKAFDTKPMQVLIEAKIIEISLTDDFKYGIDWTAVISGLQKKLIANGSFTISAVPSIASGVPGVDLSIGSLGGSDFNAVVDFLKKNADVNTLSSPHITVLNNQEAKIVVGTNQPYATTTVTQGSSTTTNSANVTFIDVGVKLYVTPTINREGIVTMKIKPEISSKGTDYTYPSGAVDGSGKSISTSVPVVNTSSAETTVTVKDGCTIIIGGLIKDVRNDTINKVPYLGDMPLVGYGFKNQNNQVTKSEMVIFLTPHIISGENDVVRPPMSKPIGEGEFTLRENISFERRDRRPLDPTMFKDEKMKMGEGPDAKAEASVAAYFEKIKSLIFSKLAVPKGPVAVVKGDKVRLVFVLYSGGNLAKTPEVIESTNVLLESAALKAIEKAVPFPPFPSDIKEQSKSFTIDIIYDPEPAKKKWIF